VDLNVDSNNDGLIDPDNSPAGIECHGSRQGTAGSAAATDGQAEGQQEGHSVRQTHGHPLGGLGQGNDSDSPPAEVPSARQTPIKTSSLIQWTEPSQRAVITPPA